jgi:putative polyhydroxyalkanoate system protein
MPAFSVEVPHALGKAGARQRLDSFLEKLADKYKGQVSDLQGSWAEDVLSFSFSTFGIKIAGTMQVADDKVVMRGDLPFSAMIFKGKITSGIQDALTKALA